MQYTVNVTVDDGLFMLDSDRFLLITTFMENLANRLMSEFTAPSSIWPVDTGFSKAGHMYRKSGPFGFDLTNMMDYAPVVNNRWGPFLQPMIENNFDGRANSVLAETKAALGAGGSGLVGRHGSSFEAFEQRLKSIMGERLQGK